VFVGLAGRSSKLARGDGQRGHLPMGQISRPLATRAGQPYARRGIFGDQVVEHRIGEDAREDVVNSL